MSRVLLLTTEPLPLPGLPATGAGLRAWGLAMGLRARGIDVKLMMPANALATFGGNLDFEKEKDKDKDKESWPGWVGVFERGKVDEAVRRENPDAIVLQHWGMAGEIGELGVPLAIDLAGPHLLERRLWGSQDPEGDLRDKLDALRRADFLVCSGERQRLYFLPYLAMAGWDTAADDALPVIPYSFQPLEPGAKARNDRFIYGGFLLPWQDPTIAIEESLAALDRAGKGELLFIGGAHPTLDVSRGRFEPLLNKLEQHPRARVVAPMSFDRFSEILGEGGVALDLMARNPERELAFTSRTIVYMSAGLPVIHDNYSELSGIIEDSGAGWCVGPNDRAAVAKLLDGILAGSENVAARAKSARRLIAEELNWEMTIGPLAEWCRDPKFRDDKTAARLGFEEQGRRLARVEADLRATRSELETLRGKRWVKWGLGLFQGRGIARWPMAALALAIGIALFPVFLINDLFARKD